MPLGTAKPPKVTRKTALAVSKLVKQFKSDDEDVRLDLIRRLRLCALPEVLKLIVHRLVPDLHSPDDVVRRRSMDILALLGSQGFCPDTFQSRAPGLLLMMQADNVEDRVYTLRYMGRLLQRQNQDQSRSRRKLVSQFVPALLVGLNDHHDAVRHEAVALLKSLGADGDSLVGVLQSDLKQQGEEVPREMVLDRVIQGHGRNQAEPAQQDAKSGSNAPADNAACE